MRWPLLTDRFGRWFAELVAAGELEVALGYASLAKAFLHGDWNPESGLSILLDELEAAEVDADGRSKVFPDDPRALLDELTALIAEAQIRWRDDRSSEDRMTYAPGTTLVRALNVGKSVPGRSDDE